MAEERNVDTEKIKKAVLEILEAVGEDVNREGLKNTPDRVARMYSELLAGMSQDPEEYIGKTFTEKDIANVVAYLGQNVN